MNIYKITILIILFSISNSFAQLIGGEAFLQGTYLEVGVSSCGSNGTAAVAPASYHANSDNGNLGFVADPDQDGWNVGTPSFYGDYFLPGDPLEGWGIEFNGSTYFNSNGGGFGVNICTNTDIPGSITGFSSTASQQSTTWEGGVSGVDVKLKTWFPTDALYFITDITLYNTTASNIYDIYFLRHVDPDNEQTNTAEFQTEQDIVFQPDAFNCAALVSATGLQHNAYLGLGSMNANAVAAFHDGLSINLPTNIADVYNGVAPSFISGGGSVADEPISITFNIDTLLAGDSVTFSYAYILDSAQLNEALSQTGNSNITANGVDISSTLNYSYCPMNPIVVSIEIGGGYDWVWTPNTNFVTPNTGDSVAVVVTGDIEYSVTGTSYDCGNITRTITINADSNLLANAGPDQVICNGDSIQLLGSGETGFIWSPSTGIDIISIAQPMAFPSINTTYTLTTSCGVDEMDVTIIPDLSTSFLPLDTICMYESTNINIITSPSSVPINSTIWSNDTTLSSNVGSIVTASPLFTTTYYTTTTSVDGCVVEDSITLYIEGMAPNIQINPTDTTICAGESYNIYSGHLPLFDEYTISPIPYSLISGTGTSVSLSDDQVSSALPIGFNFSFYGNVYTEFYISSNGFITFSPIIGSGCCSGQLLPDINTPSNLIAFAWEDLNPNGGGTIEYFLNGTTPFQTLVMNFIDVPHFGGGDLVNAQVVLFENTNAVLINIGSQPDAFGTTTLGLENIDGTEGVSPVGYNSTQWSASNESWLFSPAVPNVVDFTWSPSLYLNNDTAENVISTPADDVTYTLIADNGFCQSISSITIHVDSSLIFINSSDDVLTCSNIDKELFVNVTSSTPITYDWSPTTALNCNNCDTVISTSSSSICYEITINNTTNGCVIVDSICIEEMPFTIDSLIADDVSCYGFSDGEITTYISQGASPYNYSIGGSAPQNSSLFTDLNAGTYSISVEDDNGCENSQSVTIHEPTIITIDVETEDTACYNVSNGSVLIEYSGGESVSGDYTYTINSSTNVGTSPIIIENLLGDSLYNISIQDDNGCTLNKNFSLEEYDALIINISEDSCTFYEENITLGVNGNYVSYNWTPTTNLSCSDCPNPIATVYQTIDYSLVVTDIHGCENINETNVNVCLLLTDVLLPDAFTPNADGVNDRFIDEDLIPLGYQLKNLNIYNRWGKLVYTFNSDDGWDGTYNGIAQKEDLYIYYIEFLTNDGETKSYNGNINLMR